MQAKLEADDDGLGEDALVDENGISIGMTRIEAERLKITYDVLKRKREHDLEMGRVVLVEDVAKMVGKRESEIRTKLLAIPNGHAPQIHALKTVMEVQDYLQTVLTQALQALSDA
jgi:predicted component of type VI protein secretion system